MYSNYSYRKHWILKLDLEGDKELEFAYLFLTGALERAKPLGEVGEKLRAMCEAMKFRIIERNEEILESKKHPLCVRCCMEIHRDKDQWVATEGGNFAHKVCPPLKANRPDF
jgi:hypothetical protein